MAITTLERTQIEKVFIAFLNAAPSITYLDQLVGYAGRANVLAKDLSKTDAFLSIYPVALTNAEFADKFVANFIGSTASDAAKAYVKDEVVKSLNAGVSRGDTLFNVVVALQSVQDGDATFGATKKAFENKVAVADYYAVTKLGTATDLTTLQKVIAGVTDTSDVSSSTALDAILSGTVTGQTFTLTNGTDVASANIFNSGLVYNPAGTDRINALQSEDTLTGTGTNPTLNATLGNSNDNGATTVTPTLNNINTINLDVTGTLNTLDVRFADSLQTLSINKLTAEATNGITIDNINQVAANLTAKNSANVDNTVKFQYTNGTLAGTTANGNAETGNLTISNIQANPLFVGNAAQTEGFETLNLDATNTNLIKALKATDLENLKITGSGNLTILNTTQETDRVKFVGGGLDIGDGLGIRSIDASAFAGTANIDISSAVGGHADPANSGVKYYTDVKGGTGNDTFWTKTALAAQSATLRDTLDGGTGANKLVSIDAGVTKTGNFLPSVTNIQTLDLRLQAGGAETAYVSAFDAALTTVNLRNEQKTGTAASVAGAFTLREVGAALAASGNINLLHASGTGTGAGGAGTATGVVDTVNVMLKDSSGAADLVNLTVKSDLNTSSTYDYSIALKTEAAAVAGATAAVIAANKVENLTINDNDNETNTVTITGNDAATAKDLTGTVTLNGGSTGKGYTVKSTLTAKTVDAANQLSNLTLTVGTADQTIKLGAGDDLLTFDGVNDFNGNDVISDVGGIDTVRAAFSKDVAGTPDLGGIEKLQIVATANSTIDLAKATSLTQLAILSDKAVDQNGEVFSTGLATGVDITDVITLKNTKLTEVNFFGDEDATVTGTTVSTIQTFNGLTLENNNGDTVAVKIAAPLQNLTNVAGAGITTYNLGQLTTHGVKDLSIVVSNEITTAKATTAISNIWDRDLVNLTLTATGNVNVGTVTGNTVNSNIKTFNAAAVGGKTTAIVKALGDSAVVTLAGGDDDFNALGSAGNNITIQAGEGNNTITGTAQSDYIYSGAGNDIIHADRGNNTIKSGAGNDTVDALNGSNTIDLGSGFADKATFNYDTVGQLNLATNVVAGSGTSASINFDNNNDGTVDTVFGFAVGDGAEASIKFTGTTFDKTASTLNGRSAFESTLGSAITAGTTAGVEANQSNLIVLTGATAQTGAIAGGSAADVILDFGTTTGAYNVSSGAGNDAIVIAQTNTSAHTITGGTGADRVVLSAAAAADTLVLAEGDSTAAARDVVTNFQIATDKFDVSTVPTALGVTAGLKSLDFNGDGTDDITVTAGYVTTSVGVIGGADGKVTVAAMLTFLQANAKNVNDIYLFNADTNGTAGIGAGDNTFVVQHLSTDTVVELVGAQATPLTIAHFV